MNHTEFMKQRSALKAAVEAKSKEFVEANEPVEALEALVTRTWVAWDWKFEIMPGRFNADRNGEYISSLYQFERDRSGCRTATCWQGPYAMSCVVFLYNEWVAGSIDVLPPSGDLISALVPRQDYPDRVKKQCELMRALLAGS